MGSTVNIFMIKSAARVENFSVSIMPSGETSANPRRILTCSGVRITFLHLFKIERKSLIGINGLIVSCSFAIFCKNSWPSIFYMFVADVRLFKSSKRTLKRSS